MIQHIPIRLFDSVNDQLVTHRTTINEEVLHIALRTGEGGQANPAFNRQSRCFGFDMHGVIHKLRIQQSRNALFSVNSPSRRAQRMNNAVVVAQGEGNVVATQGEFFQRIFKVREFSLFSSQKFPTSRSVKKQITRFNSGACRMSSWADFRLHIATFRFHLPCLIGTFFARRQGQARYGRNTGQRLSTEAHGANGLEIIQRGDLTGSVATERQRQIVLANTVTVVPHSE